MTDVIESRVGCDHSRPTGAPDKIEITPAMLKAGIEELASHHLDIMAPDDGTNERVARAIFSAMAAVQVSQVHH
jgi:hypothetical protein